MLDRGIYQLSKSIGLNRKYYVENEDQYGISIRIAVPGVKSSREIKATVSSGKLKVFFNGNEFCDSFLYLYKLPDNVIKEETFADLNDGVLEIFIPKNLEKSK